MTAKAIQEKVTADEASRTEDTALPVVETELKSILRDDLQLSKTNPRRRVVEETIASLADSIRTQGILEPLIVRKVGEKHEIVCGARRYRAAALAGVMEVPCIIRELTDEQVLDIQIHENLHREDVHPMDEAFSYQFLQLRLNCDVKELALRVGKSEGYILNRLKLNSLIEEAQKDIDEELLPLAYALEIAKYDPEIQRLIYREVYRKEGKYEGGNYVYVPIKGQTIPLRSLLEWVNTNIHRLISKAPFNIKATDLRTDGLACIKCPDRTGAAVSLFEPNRIGKKDACLNPSCYKQKAQNHLLILRQTLADLRKVDPSEVPLVKSWSYSDGGGYLGRESAAVIKGAKRGAVTKNCDQAIKGIDIEPDNYGKTILVCLKASGCDIHWTDRKTPGATSVVGKSKEEEEADQTEVRRVRREEIWNAKVAEAVRKRVFKRAAEKFEKKFRITDIGNDFLPQLVDRFWRMTSSADSNNLNSVVKLLLKEWEEKNGEAEPISGPSFGRSDFESFRAMERGLQFRLLFLLVHCQKGTMRYNNGYASQQAVAELAKEFDVDYSQIDAEVRLELSPNKYKEVHQKYLDNIRAKVGDGNVPYLFSEKWKPKD